MKTLLILLVLYGLPGGATALASQERLDDNLRGLEWQLEAEKESVHGELEAVQVMEREHYEDAGLPVLPDGQRIGAGDREQEPCVLL